MSLPKVVEDTSHAPGGAGKWEHVPSTALPEPPEALLPRAMHTEHLPRGCVGRLDIQTGAVRNRQL